VVCDLSWDIAPGYDPLGVLASNLDLARSGELVRIVPGTLATVSRLLDVADPAPVWDTTYHYSGDDESTAQYVYVLDALNFCFWGEPRWQVECGEDWVNGYYALALALKRAIERGVPILHAGWMAQVTPTDLAGVLGGRGEIPLLAERAHSLNEAGAMLARRFGGRFSAMVEWCKQSAPTLAIALSAFLTSYDDVARLGQNVHRFYKRAQICASDLSSALAGRPAGELTGLELLTAFADYKLPQVLRAFGVLEYQPALAAKVDARVELPAGSVDEVAIRAATVWAVEHLRQALIQRGSVLSAREIDWKLWLLGQKPLPNLQPYHLTRTIYY